MSSRLIHLMFVLAVVALAISGVGQMPIFKRYYIADIPGLAWTADFYITHLIHYLAAAVLLAVLGYRGGLAMLERRVAFSFLHWLQLAMLAGLVVTGALRVWKNLPDAHMGMAAGMVVAISHMVFAAGWGVVGLLRWRMFRTAQGRPGASGAPRPGEGPA